MNPAMSADAPLHLTNSSADFADDQSSSLARAAQFLRYSLGYKLQVNLLAVTRHGSVSVHPSRSLASGSNSAAPPSPILEGGASRVF
jgi:hypothetical protein